MPSHYEVLVLWVATWIDQLILSWLSLDHATLPYYLYQIYSLLKGILHYLTGKSQIERLVRCQRLRSHRDGLLLPSAHLINLISKSVKYSKTLSFGINQEDLARKITSKKRISDIKTLKLALNKIYEVIELKQKMENLRAKTFSKADKEDLQVLLALWKSLKGTAAPEIPSSHWGQIGFQGSDPGTDFRGMGFLGLYQLAELSRLNPKVALEAFSVASRDSNLWFPYAVTGINVTAFQYQLLKSHKLDNLLYGSVGSVESRYAFIYADIFTNFLCRWIDANPRDIMDFPRVFAQVKTSFVMSIN